MEYFANRHRIVDEMRRLVDKYPGGFEEWENTYG